MGALYTIEINGGDSYHSYTSTVIWDKKGKVLTDFCATTGVRECRDATDDEIRPLDGVSVHDKSERFKSYKGKNLRIRLCTFGSETSCTKEITLSGFEMARVPDKNPGFFRYQIKYSEYREGYFMKEVFFDVRGLTEWVYACVNASEDFTNRREWFNEWLTDKRKSWVAYSDYGAMGVFSIKATNNSPDNFRFKYFDEVFTLSLYDECRCINTFESCFPDERKFSYERKCYFGIKSSREHDKEFFETLIRKITRFLSLLFGKEAIAEHVWEGSKQQDCWNYYLSEKENSGEKFYESITYDEIRDKFESKLTKWLEACAYYEAIIERFFRDNFERLPSLKKEEITEEEKRNIEETFFRACRLLEAYGNIHTKGKSSTEDIKTAVKAVDEKVFESCIIQCEQFLITADEFKVMQYNFAPESERLADLVTTFRNYFIHPYCNGKKKTPQSEGIDRFFTKAGYGTLYRWDKVVEKFVRNLLGILYLVLLQSKNKGRTEKSKNLFPETNHTREDFGEIILKYLKKCRNDVKNSEKLKEYIIRIRRILLINRESPNGETSEAAVSDDIPTDEHLKCLSEILAELTFCDEKVKLTFCCEEVIKKAFDEGVFKAVFEENNNGELKNLEPIFEYIMKDFRGGSVRPSEGKNFGELMVNLKNSFDPNAGSLVCEQFTDYRDAVPDYKALTNLTNSLSNILWQLLCKEASLEEFFMSQ